MAGEEETHQNPPECNYHQPLEEEDGAAITALDLTSYQLHDLDSVELPPSLVELDLTANRLSKLDPRISLLTHLKKLSLRQNLFEDSGVEPLSRWDAISGVEVGFLSFPFFYPFFCEL